ncbi:S-adenosyl-L-methionine-dependent methyltransferase [Hymenopellis radicata]|nr:S-adenosyl-L-methionine-dependent methyltransferase [Hymenopellis radicata]
MAPTALDALVDILSSQVKTFQTAYTDSGQPVPSIDEPWRPSTLDADPALIQTRKLIEGAFAAFTSVALAYIEDNNIVDILIEAGPQGLHLNDIAAISGTDASTLGRFLRYLATRHVFKELSPNVFTNNRVSSLLFKMKSVKEIQANPIDRYEKSPMAAFVSYGGTEILKIVPSIMPYLKDPSKAATPFNLAYDTTDTIWEFAGRPGNEASAKRQAVLMAGANKQFPPIFSSMCLGIDGKSLQPGDVVVDVGGGNGSATAILYNAFPKFQYVVQDLSQQITEAEKYWDSNSPDAVKNGIVKLQVHNFFTPQPVKGAAVYFLRMILHDWSDAKCKDILTNLRVAASPSSKVVVFELLATYTCADASNPVEAPYPLLGNLGVAGGGFLTGMDIGLLASQGGKERTKDEFEALGKECGWKLETVIPGSCILLFSLLFKCEAILRVMWLLTSSLFHQ